MEMKKLAATAAAFAALTLGAQAQDLPKLHFKAKSIHLASRTGRPVTNARSEEMNNQANR